MKPLRAVKSRASNLLPENRKLISKINELKAILEEAKEFRKLLSLPAGNNTAGVGCAAMPTETVPSSTSLLPPKVFGRDADRDRIIDLLTNKTAAETGSTGYSGVAIVGHGGAGKSTLAGYVYNDERVKGHFDVLMWVCISRKLDIHRHTQEIIESASNKECPRLDNLDTLQCKLRDILQKSEKFLLVLDDVWFEQHNSETGWDLFLDPLAFEKQGSKVLVTSRLDVLPAALRCNKVVRLDNMEDAEFLALFKYHAFSGTEIGDQRLRLRLEEIAEKIAKRLGQSPLAARTVGSQLSRRKNIAEWEAPLKIDKLSEPLGALLWSYKKLHPHLQRCFLYCSLFPKGHKYKVDELILLWVAEGLVDSCNQNRKLEDVGRDYFSDLVSGSFFQIVTERYIGTWYVMHDLLHDLAESLSSNDCFRLEDDTVTEIPCTVRHLSVRVESIITHKQSICKLHRLRTVICIEPLRDDASDVFLKILQNLKKLRVLYLSCYTSRKLHESISELKQLRYLNLIKTLITELPGSLGTLYHLQLLQLNHKVQSLPDELCNLSKLRHLEGYDDRTYRLFEEALPQIPNIGKLTSLQQLHIFSVQKKKGYELRQLRNMNELGGCLKVTDLENVTGKDEALESQLHRKSQLKELQLFWNSENDMGAEHIPHLEILEGLKPAPQLERLMIVGYQSPTYPNWLLDDSYLKNLENFGLYNCSVLEGLPPDAKLFRYCSDLCLDDVPNLKTLPCLPACLTNLSVGGCPLLTFVITDELEDQRGKNVMRTDILVSKLSLIWEVDSGSAIKGTLSEEHSCFKHLMPLMEDDISKHLQTIKSALEEGKDDLLVKTDIINAWVRCHEQRIGLIYRSTEQLLTPPSGLCHLKLSSCSVTDGALAICLRGLTSLRGFHLKQIMNLTALPSEEIFQRLTKLKHLSVCSCWYFRSLGGLRAATSVSCVAILCCPSMEFAIGADFMPMCLEELIIYDCMIAAETFSNVMPHLKELSMYHCRSTVSLSIGHLTFLESLSIGGFPDLCFLEGLYSLQLRHVQLIDVPKLTAECISQFRVQKSLYVSSFDFLSHMLSTDGFTVPAFLSLESCKEPTVSFEESADFSSVKCLRLCNCEMKSLPTNMNCLTSLENLDIYNCKNISCLPDLPSSLQHICIWRCELLEKSCRAPDGESWPKIAHIRWKEFR